MKDGEERNVEKEEIMKEHVLEKVGNMDHQALIQAINLFFSNGMNTRIHMSFAKVLIMMSGDPTITSIFPFRNTNQVLVIVSWITYIITRIEHLYYSKNRPVPDIDKIPNSYDLRKGVAYYFTPSGNQMRKMPGYEESANKINCA